MSALEAAIQAVGRGLLGLLTALACLETGSAAGVRVLFDPAAPEAGPFPTDFLTVEDSRQKTGLRMALPLPDCSVAPSLCREIEFINELDGSSVHPRASVRFSGPIDAGTLREGIFFVWLDGIPGTGPGSELEGHVSRINQAVYDPETHTALAKSDQVLDQQRRYLLVVTETVRDAAGDPVEADPSFLNCVEQAPNAYCQDLAAVLGANGAPGNPVSASVFTTLSATAWLENVRGQLRSTAAAFLPAEVNILDLAGILTMTLSLQTAEDPEEFLAVTVPAPDLLLPDVGRIAFGSFESPRFLGEDLVIPATPSAEDVPLPEATERIHFHAFLPEGAPPPGGYPVVIFGHGMGDSRFGGPTLVANSFAEAGFATVAMSAVGHGSGARSTLEIFAFGSGNTVLSAPGRGSDRDGDGDIEATEGCRIIDADRPVVLRDCLRQTVVDLMQLVRVLQQGVDFDGDSNNELNGDHIVYAGQSLGGMYGTMLNAVEPSLRTAVFNVAGGSVVDISRWSPDSRSLVEDLMRLRTPSPLNAGNTYIDNYVLRDQPARVNRVRGAIEVQDYFERMEWLQMPGDPLAYAAHLRASPLDGVPPKAVLWQFARGDETVPNPTSSALIRAARMEESVSLYRHDIARTRTSELRENPHPYLVDTLSVPGLLIANAAQRQMAGFLAAEGAVIPDVNSGPRVLLRRDVFETAPGVLPDDLGFEIPLANVSAASFEPGGAAPESIVSGFGRGLANGSAVAVSLPLPTELAGTTVVITDSLGVGRVGSLFAVTPSQVNYLVPPGTALGTATVTIANDGGQFSTGRLEIRNVAPGLFSANSNGKGAAAGLVQRVLADGTSEFSTVFGDSPVGSRAAVPIPLGRPGERVFLILFGTGLRGRSDPSRWSAFIDREPVAVLFVGPQGEFAGLDQINLGEIPGTLAGRGEVEVELRTGDARANVVTVALE